MNRQTSGRSAAGPTKFVPRSVVNLSPESVETLTVRDLRRLLLRLVKVLHEREARRPSWWPHILPWTQQRFVTAVKTATPLVMRKLAKKLCNFLTQHSSSKAASLAAPVPAFSQPRVLDWVNSHPPSRLSAQPLKSGEKSSTKKSGDVPYLDIYLCYQCNEEFSTKDTLQKHQVQCQRGTLPLSIPSTPPVSEAPSPAQPACTSEDPGSVSMASGATSSSGCLSLTQSQFVAGLDLVPLHRARKIRQARRRNTECETIDLEEPQTPVSPSTPRSHKILITQLSRDASNNSLGGSGNSGGLGSRQSSCLRQSLDKRPDSNGKLNRDTSSTSLVGSGNSEELGGRRSSLLRLSLDNRPENVGNEAEQPAESDGESSESSAEDTDEPKLRKKTLFSIDVSSVLGQRIIKHMTSEVNVPVISNLEEFCRTPIKDKYQDRLRNRQTTYPVTWKLTRKRQQQYCHLYKFTKADKLEFKETLRSGLNLESRKLKESLKKCSVVVKRLSRKTLLKWTSVARVSLTKQLLTQAKASFSEASVFPDGPTFLLTDVDRVLGLKRKDGKPELARKLLASHCVSETANAELQSQKLTVYRCLLTDLYSSVTSDGGQCSGTVSTVGPSWEGSLRNKQKYPALLSLLSGNESKPFFQSKAAEDAPVDVEKPLKIDIPSPTGTLQPLEKSSFQDDSFSVKTLSSDEEMDKSAACCPLCEVRSRCKCPSKKAAAVGHAVCSPALTSQVSSLSKASVSPPQLDPLSLTPRVSSQPSLSPPDLSPVSQLGEACLQSSSLRKSTRRSTLLLKTSSSPKLTPTPLAAAAGLSGTNIFQCPSAPSPGQMLSGRRGDRATARPADTCPSPARRTHSSSVLSASSSLLQPLLVTQTQRPHTRSSSKQNVADESSGSVSQQKPCLTRWDCSCGGTGCVAGHSLTLTSSVTETSKRLASASIESPLMPSSVSTDKNKMNGPCNHASVRQKSVICSFTDNADITASKEKRKAETVERVEKKTVEDKVQTRSTLQESSQDRSKRTKQREDTEDCKKLRNGKSCDAGDSTAKAPQKMDLVKKTQAENISSKVQKKEAREAQKMKAAGEKENTTDDVESGDRDATGSSRALRNREKKYSREVNKETPDFVSTHTKTVPIMNVSGSKVACQVPDQHCKDVGEMPSAVAKKTEAAKEERVSIRTLRSDITGSSLYESEVNGKERGTSAIQMTPVLRKASSKKSIAASALTDASVQREPTEKPGRITRGSSLSSTSGTKISQHGDSTENPGRTTRGSSLSSISGTEISWTKANEQKTDTLVGTAEPKVVKRKSLTSEEVNPFLATRAETRLFSSRIKEHTHRAWKLAQNSPTVKRGSSRVLKSGNTSRMGSVSLASPANSFESRPQVIGHSANSSSFLLNKEPATESSGTKSPRSDAGLTQGGPMSPTRMSPKQMLSVLESAKGNIASFKEKYRKESARGHTSSHGSSAKSGVHAGSLTQNTGSLGSCEQSVTNTSQLPSATKTISSRSKSMGIQKSQGSPSKTIVSQKTLLKSSKLALRAKNGSSSSEGVTLKSASSQKWSQSTVARTTGKRSTSNTACGESGSPCKKVCV